MEVQGDWTLLRRALLAEYNTTSHQGAFSSATVIPSAMVPVPAAAPPLSTQRGVATQNVTSFSITPIPAAVPPFQPPQPLISRPSINEASTSSIVTRHGCICVIVGFEIYYIAVSDLASAWCQLTKHMHKAATLEAVSIGENMEFKITGPGRGSGSCLGMVWGASRITTGSHAALLPVKKDGQKVTSLKDPNDSWEGAISVTTYTSSVDRILTPILGTEKGAFMVNPELIYITNDIPAFLEKFPNWKEAKCVFEPL